MIFNYIGNYSLVISVIISVIILFLSILSLQKTNIRTKINLDKLTFFQFFFVLISFFSLIVLFLLSEFSNITVFNNSHTTKPLFYKISGTWGNHEGSLLLWLLILTLFIFLYFLNSKSRSIKERLLTLIFQEVIIIGFLIFSLKTSNPFNQIFPIPEEGLGLNPILQDPILAIHPPVLYLGYVSTSIIFSSSLASLMQGNVNNLWAKHIKNWIFISWIFLTIGILLGSIWAYYELGWGGFWFWDPVENISLMPWLSLTALLHCVLVLEKRSLLNSWSVVLSISTFTLSVCGTFLVRSGILNSVHTFANDPKRGIFILIFLFVLILIALFIFFVLYKPKNEQQKNFLFSKETSILLNNCFMMYFLSVILVGTVYPIFLEVIADEKISVGPPFYTKLLIPFLIPFLILMTIGPNTKWIKDNFNFINVRLILLFFISILLSYLILREIGLRGLFSTVLIGSALYLFFITVMDFFVKNQINLSQKISHFGFSLLVLSIILNGIFSSEIITNIKVGEKYDFKRGSIYFEKINNFEKQNYISIVGTFRIYDDNGKEIYLKPELRIFNQPIMITSEADIKTSFYSDKFLVMNLVKGNDFYNIRYQTKPFMIWIWLSTIILASGGLVNFFYKKIK